MNIYLCLIFVIIITLIDFFLNMCKEAVMTANISRIKQLADDDNNKASILAELRSGQKPFFLATLHMLCTVFYVKNLIVFVFGGIRRRLPMSFGLARAFRQTYGGGLRGC